MSAMQQLTVMQDPVADALDDMAALGLHWTRNRERGRMPNGIRSAMLLVAREALAHADAQERSTNQFMGDLCGPTAYARNNGNSGLGLCDACGAYHKPGGNPLCAL